MTKCTLHSSNSLCNHCNTSIKAYLERIRFQEKDADGMDYIKASEEEMLPSSHLTGCFRATHTVMSLALASAVAIQGNEISPGSVEKTYEFPNMPYNGLKTVCTRIMNNRFNTDRMRALVGLLVILNNKQMGLNVKALCSTVLLMHEGGDHAFLCYLNEHMSCACLREKFPTVVSHDPVGQCSGCNKLVDCRLLRMFECKECT